jgi:amidase
MVNLMKLLRKSVVPLCLALCLCFSVRPNLNPAARPTAATAENTSFDLETATIEDISRAMDKGALTSEQLVRLSLARIKAHEPELHAIITLNSHALDEARALDAERRSKGPRSPLHGVPVLLKDVINTRDLPTTLGFYGLKGAVPYADAEIVYKLRAAGAIVLAKVNLSELASGPSMSSLGGQTHNPHNLAYSPAGSSSGTAVGVAAGYAPIGIGTDTTGSVRWPAATNGVVGLRPTMGVISTIGVMPNSPTLDAVGPIARNVSDVALLLSILEGIDDRDPAIRNQNGRYPTDYKADLRPDSLRGARIGFLRHDFSGDDPEVDAVINAAVEKLKTSGATVINVELPFWLVHFKSDLESIIVRTESVPSLNAYLQTSFPPGYPRTHAEILAMSEKIASSAPPGILPNPGRLDGYRSEAGTPPPTNPSYIAARDQGRAFVKASMEAILIQDGLDALVYPTSTMPIGKIGDPPKRNARGLWGNFGLGLVSLAGWPELTVPAGITSDGLPVGISFIAPAYSDMRLLAYGYAFEQATHALRQPTTTPPLPGDRFTY